jgi:hypothetical protein
MAKTISAKQLRDLRVNVRAVVLLVRKFTPHLVRELVERIAVQDRVRGLRPSRRRGASRPLKIGVTAFGVVAAGAAAAKLAAHRGPFGGDGLDTDRA